MALLVWLVALQGWAQPLRVVTWKLEEFALASTNAPAPEPDHQRLRALAEALKPIEADLIILEGLPDKKAAQRIAGYLKPGVYHVVHHAHFRKNGPGTIIVGLPTTILAKKLPVSTRSVEWRTTGQIEAPGGFIFSTFPHGTNTICLYTVHTPDAPDGPGLEALHLRQRELASQYLLHHANWVASTLTNQLASVVLFGDFLPEARLATNDAIGRVLEQSSFHAAPQSPALRRGDKPGPAPALPKETFFVRHAEFAGAPLPANAKAFDHGPLVWDLIVRPTELKTPEPVLATAAPILLPPRKLSDDPSRFIWMAVGVVLTILVVVVFFQWLAWRRWTNSLLPVTRTGQGLVIDFADAPNGRGRRNAPAGSTNSLPESEATDDAVAAWQERAFKAERRATAAAEMAQSGLKPHLLGMMREKLVAWLTFQRSHLLHSQASGTVQVIELEERLERISSQFQERVVAKDQRIAALETDLLAKDRMLQELLQAREGGTGSSSHH